MYNLAPTDLRALANLDLAFKERATDVRVVMGVVHVHAVRPDGQETVYMHNGGNVWSRVRADATDEVHFIDRDAPTSNTYIHVCPSCFTRYAGGYAGTRCVNGACERPNTVAIDRPHAHEVGDVVYHTDDETTPIVICECTWRVRGERAYPTYTVNTTRGDDECVDVLCTRDLIAR